MTTPPPSSESLDLGAACFAFFVAGGLAAGGEESAATVFLIGFWDSLGNSEPPEVEWSTFSLSTGAGERVFGVFMWRAAFSNIGCSSSELSVVELSSGSAFCGPVPSLLNDRCCDFVDVDSNQSGTWVRQVGVHSIAC